MAKFRNRRSWSDDQFMPKKRASSHKAYDEDMYSSEDNDGYDLDDDEFYLEEENAPITPLEDDEYEYLDSEDMYDMDDMDSEDLYDEELDVEDDMESIAKQESYTAISNKISNLKKIAKNLEQSGEKKFSMRINRVADFLTDNAF